MANNDNGLVADYEEEREMAAKQFQRAFNTNRSQPSLRRLIARTSDISESFSSGDKFASSLASTNGANTSVHIMEDIPVYRELEEKWVPKWRRLFNRACPQPIRNALKPPTTREAWIQFVFVHLPILHWLWRYTPKQLIGDVIAGLTIGVTHIPQGISLTLSHPLANGGVPHLLENWA